jgi:hypothetical protein
MSSINNEYVEAVKYLKDCNITYDVNILSAVCKYLYSDKQKNELYQELINIYRHERTNLILSAIVDIKNNLHNTNNVYAKALLNNKL